MVKVSLLVMVCLAFLGCGAASHISSEPPRALVYVNGTLIGKTPVVYHHHRGLPRRYHIQIYREGYEPLDLYADTRMSYLWGILGSALYVPKLWAWSLANEYVFRLRPLPGTEPPDWRGEWQREDEQRRLEEESMDPGYDYDYYDDSYITP